MKSIKLLVQVIYADETRFFASAREVAGLIQEKAQEVLVQTSRGPIPEVIVTIEEGGT